MTIHFTPPAVLTDGKLGRRRWDSDEDRLLRLRLAFSGLISDEEAVRTFARYRYCGTAR
jgi:hypothetical protein